MRLEFRITNAKILLIEKKRKDSIIKKLYIDMDNITNMVISNINKVSSTEKGKVIIKRMENVNADR